MRRSDRVVASWTALMVLEMVNRQPHRFLFCTIVQSEKINLLQTTQHIARNSRQVTQRKKVRTLTADMISHL